MTVHMTAKYLKYGSSSVDDSMPYFAHLSRLELEARVKCTDYSEVTNIVEAGQSIN